MKRYRVVRYRKSFGVYNVERKIMGLWWTVKSLLFLREAHDYITVNMKKKS